MGENHQLAGKWARHFAQLSIINSIIGVNLFFGQSLPNDPVLRTAQALATGQYRAGG